MDIDDDDDDIQSANVSTSINWLILLIRILHYLLLFTTGPLIKATFS